MRSGLAHHSWLSCLSAFERGAAQVYSEAAIPSRFAQRKCISTEARSFTSDEVRRVAEAGTLWRPHGPGRPIISKLWRIVPSYIAILCRCTVNMKSYEGNSNHSRDTDAPGPPSTLRPRSTWIQENQL